MNGRGYDPLEGPQVKRTYTPEEAGHDKHRRPVSRYSLTRRRRKKVKVNAAAVVVTLVFALVIGLSLFLIISGKNRPDPNTYEDPTVPEETTEAVTTEDPLPYFTLELFENGIYYGDLILVNSYNEYVFPEEMENDLVTIEDNKSEYCTSSGYSTHISGTALEAFNLMCKDYFDATGFQWLQINSAYRSREHQEQLYSDYVRDYGEEYAKQYVANPGFSEHHTGLGIDLNVNRNGAISYIESDEGCAWFRENCNNYGFILRYPDDKVHLTGISYESWHYRYVGLPHSQIMKDMNFCHEEYIDYIKAFTYDTNCLGYSVETGVYDVKPEEFYEAERGVMIYFVPGGEKSVETFVPKDCEYTVSGNNVDGFIITCVK